MKIKSVYSLRVLTVRRSLAARYSDHSIQPCIVLVKRVSSCFKHRLLRSRRVGPVSSVTTTQRELPGTGSKWRTPRVFALHDYVAEVVQTSDSEGEHVHPQSV